MPKSETYVTESAALVFCKTADSGDSDSSMPWRADDHEVAKKIINASSGVTFAHAIYGANNIIAMVSGLNPVERRKCVAAIRGIIASKNHPEHKHNFVTETQQLLITSLHGIRQLERSDWRDTKPFCGWMFAKVGIAAPADDLAESLVDLKEKKDPYFFSFAAPLIGRFDIAAFLEADDKLTFDAAINTISRRTYYKIETQIVASNNVYVPEKAKDSDDEGRQK